MEFSFHNALVNITENTKLEKIDLQAFYLWWKISSKSYTGKFYVVSVSVDI